MEYQILRSGGKMPIFGYGTYVADEIKHTQEQILEMSLNKALEAGYRLIDTAYGYSNEHIIGKVLHEWLSSGKVTRNELFIVTKLPMYGNQADEVEEYIKKSLRDLKLDYVDMYLIHAPFGVFKHNKSNYQEMKRDNNTDHLKIWKAMEEQVNNGLTKAIGLSNFNTKQIQRILDNCRIKPDAVQNENHLYLQEPEFVKFCNDNGIKMIAYSSLGTRNVRKSMNMSWTNKELPEMLDNKILLKVAEKHHRTPAQVLLRFIIQKKISVIPQSTNPQHIMENIQIFDFILDSEDIKSLRSQDSGEGGRIVRFLFFPEITRHPEYPFLIQD